MIIASENVSLPSISSKGSESRAIVTPYGKGQPSGQLFDGTHRKNLDPSWEKQLLRFNNKLKPYQPHLFIPASNRSSHEKLQAIQHNLKISDIIEPLLEALNNPTDVDVFALRTQDVFLLYTGSRIHVQINTRSSVMTGFLAEV